MPTYLAPGVYVEELDGGSKPLEAAGTAVGAFVGFTAAFPTDDPNDPQLASAVDHLQALVYEPLE